MMMTNSMKMKPYIILQVIFHSAFCVCSCSFLCTSLDQYFSHVLIEGEPWFRSVAKFMQEGKVWGLKDSLAVYESLLEKLKDPSTTLWKSEYEYPLHILYSPMLMHCHRISSSKWEYSGFSATHQGGQTQTLKAIKKIIAYMKNDMNVSISSSGISSHTPTSPINNNSARAPRRGTAPSTSGGFSSSNTRYNYPLLSSSCVSLSLALIWFYSLLLVPTRKRKTCWYPSLSILDLIVKAAVAHLPTQVFLFAIFKFFLT